LDSMRLAARSLDRPDATQVIAEQLWLLERGNAPEAGRPES
jgi:hypothetical protein